VLQAHFNSAQDSVLPSPKLITLELNVEGLTKPFRALVDTGASNNFVRHQTLLEHSLAPTSSDLITSKLFVRLANGTTVEVPKRTISLTLSFDEFKAKDVFIILDLDERFDLILGMPWLTRHSPLIDWSSQSLSFSHSLYETAPSTLVEEQVYWTSVSLLEEHTKSHDVFQSSTKDSTDTECDGPDAPVTASFQSKPLPTSNRFTILEDLDPPNSSSQVDVHFPLLSDVMTGTNQSRPFIKDCRHKKHKLPARNVCSASTGPAPACETINALIHGLNGSCNRMVTQCASSL
jgi:hypothetical protein